MNIFCNVELGFLMLRNKKQGLWCEEMGITSEVEVDCHVLAVDRRTLCWWRMEWKDALLREGIVTLVWS